jgi:hypothetical protein
VRSYAIRPTSKAGSVIHSATVFAQGRQPLEDVKNGKQCRAASRRFEQGDPRGDVFDIHSFGRLFLEALGIPVWMAAGVWGLIFARA